MPNQTAPDGPPPHREDRARTAPPGGPGGMELSSVAGPWLPTEAGVTRPAGNDGRPLGPDSRYTPSAQTPGLHRVPAAAAVALAQRQSSGLWIRRLWVRNP